MLGNLKFNIYICYVQWNLLLKSNAFIKNRGEIRLSEPIATSKGRCYILPL